jgi:hypothetical protein
MGLLVHGGPARRQFTEPSPKVCEFFHLHAFTSWPSKALHGLRIFFSVRVFMRRPLEIRSHMFKSQTLKVHHFTLFYISILANSFIIVIFAVTKTDVLFIQNK